MAHPRRQDERPTTYEVSVRGPLPDALLGRRPSSAVHDTPSQTVLSRRVRDPRELDELLERVQHTGLVLTEVHAAAVPAQAGSATARDYEVRIRGELGDNLLGYLGWSNQVVGAQRVTRCQLTASELNTFMDRCCESGTTVERVRRVGPGPVDEPAATD